MFRRDYNDLVGIKNSVCGYFCKQSFTVVIKLGFDPVISRGSENGGKRGRLIIVHKGYYDFKLFVYYYAEFIKTEYLK